MTTRYRLTTADGTVYPRAAIRGRGGLVDYADGLRKAQVRLARGRAVARWLTDPSTGAGRVVP